MESVVLQEEFHIQNASREAKTDEMGQFMGDLSKETKQLLVHSSEKENKQFKVDSTIGENKQFVVDSTTFRSPQFVKQSLKCLLHRWGNKIQPIPPQEFLVNLLQSRGYSTEAISYKNMSSQSKPTPKQIQDYDNDLVWSVRQQNLETLQQLYKAGRSMSACNKFSESIVHMACRRSEFHIVDFILSHGGNALIVDDYGRTPLHDACWRTSPAFDIVTLLMDQNRDFFRCADARGSLPLAYVVQPEDWLAWCVYLFHQSDKYWPKRVKRKRHEED